MFMFSNMAIAVGHGPVKPSTRNPGARLQCRPGLQAGSFKNKNCSGFPLSQERVDSHGPHTHHADRRADICEE